MIRKLIAVAGIALLAAQVGCYNSYRVSLEELSRVQEGGQRSVVKLTTDAGEAVDVTVNTKIWCCSSDWPVRSRGEAVDVTVNTKIGVVDTDGKALDVSPFNFTLTRGQLVSPDEDLLLARERIETGFVKLVSGTKTALLVAAGVAAIVGTGLYIQQTAPPRREF